MPLKARDVGLAQAVKNCSLEMRLSYDFGLKAQT